jgi:hypothetical protein
MASTKQLTPSMDKRTAVKANGNENGPNTLNIAWKLLQN